MGSRMFGAAGRYVRRELVTRAEFADVHRGHDRVLDRPVNLKMIRRLPRSEAARARLTSEVSAWARLQHPSLQRLWDADLAAHKPFIVTEFVDGRSLRDLLAAGSLTAEQLARIGLGIAGALDVVHEAGLVHGAVDADAVVVRRDGTAKLTGVVMTRLAAHVGDAQAVVGAAPDDVRALGAVLQEADGVVADTDSLGQRWRDLLVALVTEDPAHRPTALETAAVLRSILPRDEDTVILMPRAPGAHLAVRSGWTVRRYAAAAVAAAAMFVAVDGWMLMPGNSKAGHPTVQAEAVPPALASPVAANPVKKPAVSQEVPAPARRASTTSRSATRSTQLTKSQIRKALSSGKGHKLTVLRQAAR